MTRIAAVIAIAAVAAIGCNDSSKKASSTDVTGGSNGTFAVGVDSGAWTAYNWVSTIEPPTSWQDGSKVMYTIAPMASYSTVSDGVLHLGTTDTTTMVPSYKLVPSTVTGKLTIVFRAKVESTTSDARGWDFDFQMSGFREIVRLSNGSVSLVEAAGTPSITSVDTTKWHTYFITFNASSGSSVTTSVYVDGSTTASLSGTSTVTTTNSYFRAGDTSITAAYTGALDWVFWTTDGIYYPGESGLTLPSGYSL